MAGDTEAALALPETVEWQGKTLKLSPITLKIEALFTRQLMGRVSDGLRLCRTDLGEDAYRDALQGFRDDVAAYEFEWNGRVCRAATRTDAGLRDVAYLCLAELQPEFTRPQMLAIEANREKFTEVLGKLRHLSQLPKNG